MCHELYKNSGTYSIPKHYRDVLLADEGGKGIQKSIRGEFNSFSGVSTTSTQWGSGLHYGSTEVAHLYIKSVFDLARVQQKCVAVLFLDVTTAFASLLREFLIPTMQTKNPSDQFIKVLEGRNFSPEQIAKIFDVANNEKRWKDCGGDEHSLRLVSSFYDSNWNSIEGVCGVISVLTGSMAGSCLADLMFTCSVSGVF